MAQIVLIDTGTKREVNNIGDIVSVHDDDVALGDSYQCFKIVKVPGTAKDAVALINSQIPEVKMVFKSSANAGEWTDAWPEADAQPEEKEVWNDNGTWRELAKPPKYQANLAITEELTNSLTDKALTDSSKLSLVKASVSSNLKVMTENQAEIKIVSAEA